MPRPQPAGAAIPGAPLIVPALAVWALTGCGATVNSPPGGENSGAPAEGAPGVQGGFDDGSGGGGGQNGPGDGPEGGAPPDLPPYLSAPCGSAADCPVGMGCAYGVMGTYCTTRCQGDGDCGDGCCLQLYAGPKVCAGPVACAEMGKTAATEPPGMGDPEGAEMAGAPGDGGVAAPGPPTWDGDGGWAGGDGGEPGADGGTSATGSHCDALVIIICDHLCPGDPETCATVSDWKDEGICLYLARAVLEAAQTYGPDTCAILKSSVDFDGVPVCPERPEAICALCGDDSGACATASRAMQTPFCAAFAKALDDAAENPPEWLCAYSGPAAGAGGSP